MLFTAQRIRTRKRSSVRRSRAPLAMAATAIIGMAVGALLGYFLDPRAGRRRRHTARDRALSRVRHGERRAAVRARRAESHAFGIPAPTGNAARRGPGG